MRKVKILFVFFMVFSLLCGCNIGETKPEVYEKRLIFELAEKDSVTAREIFDFEWDRAFVMPHGYLNGEAFVERYDLDIKVTDKDVPTNSNDLRQRVIFVDSEGEFVYLFYFWGGEDLGIENEGVIFYPDTVIKKTSESDDLCLWVELLIDEEDYLDGYIES